MSTVEITQPLRLAVGSHHAGSGLGCAMNVISWENGDKEISDLPECSDPRLAVMVQQVNDTYCTHIEVHEENCACTSDWCDGTTTAKLLCPTCSVRVLDLAHRTVGTAPTGSGATWERSYRVTWLRIAALKLKDFVDSHKELILIGSRRRKRAAWAADVLHHVQTITIPMSDKEYTPYGTELTVIYQDLRDFMDKSWKHHRLDETDGPATDIYAALVDVFLEDNPNEWGFFLRDHLGTLPPNKETERKRVHEIIDLWEMVTNFKPEPVPAEKVNEALTKMLART